MNWAVAPFPFTGVGGQALRVYISVLSLPLRTGQHKSIKQRSNNKRNNQRPWFAAKTDCEDYTTDLVVRGVTNTCDAVPLVGRFTVTVTVFVGNFYE